MLNKELIKTLTGKTPVFVKKHSPAILTGVGIIGGVTAAVLGAKATLKLEEKIVDIQDNLELVNNSNVENPARAKGLVYVKGAMDVFKLYGPAISVGSASIVCIVSAQGIMQRRNAALVVAYSALDRSFNEYRRRVSDKIGEEKEYDLFHGVKTEKFKDPETGETITIKRADPNQISQYARFFDEYNRSWSKRPSDNLYFLMTQQNYWNDRLHAKGHVFLNEVYESLGFEPTPAGQIVGWTFKKDGEDGDGFIDFGVYDGNNERKREFVNGYERSILLDFNVDGEIYTRI